jgi:hypothetical protein
MLHCSRLGAGHHDPVHGVDKRPIPCSMASGNAASRTARVVAHVLRFDVADREWLDDPKPADGIVQFLLGFRIDAAARLRAVGVTRGGFRGMVQTGRQRWGSSLKRSSSLAERSHRNTSQHVAKVTPRIVAVTRAGGREADGRGAAAAVVGE